MKEKKETNAFLWKVCFLNFFYLIPHIVALALEITSPTHNFQLVTFALQQTVLQHNLYFLKSTNYLRYSIFATD